ncbi:MAG: hypothetical protein EXS25_05905 [Pedosphaera sp.]|nr:hypothetical protein [Pedosphaera sp.]
MNTTTQRTFDDWAKAVAHCDEKKVLDAIRPVFDMLEQLHGEKKTHGNIQPKNLHVRGDDKIDITSFENCKNENIDRNSDYAPPEAQHDPTSLPTAAGDVYGLAAVIYYAICEEPPICASRRTEKQSEKLQLGVKPRAAIAEALEKVLSLKCEDRPTMVALRELLEATNSRVVDESATTDKHASIKMPEANIGQVQSGPKESGAVAQPAVTSSCSAATTTPTLPARTPAPMPGSPSFRLVERLPVNLTVGKSFEIKISDLFKEKRGSLKLEFLNADELGFQHEREKDALIGKPKLAGEQKLNVEVTLAETDGRRIFERTIGVTVNPDPDSLWKNLPSNQSDPYWKPDSDHTKPDDEFTPVARMLAASQRGRSHAHEGLFRDDDFLVRFHRATGWHLLVVADGAGAAKYSRCGSQIACKQSLDFIEQWIDGNQALLETAVRSLIENADGTMLKEKVAYPCFGKAAYEAQKAIAAEAGVHVPKAVMKDYATTLLLAVAKHTQSGWIIAAFSIGDGGIGLMRNDGQVKTLCTPDCGEFAGQTVFLTASNVMRTTEQILNRIHIAHETDLKTLVLMTDGVTDPKFPTEASLSAPEVWKEFWTELNTTVDLSSDNKEASTDLLKWLSFRSPGNHDDRTIVLLLPNPNSNPENTAP